MVTIQDRIDYYADPNVRARIGDFLGAEEGRAPTCHYLATGAPDRARFDEHRTTPVLAALFNSGLEIYRSLWDEESLLADFDIEYVNFDHPDAAFLDPARVFALQQPLVETIQETLAGYGVQVLHALTGRGHHFVWRILRGSEMFRDLAALGHRLGTAAAIPGQSQAREEGDVGLELRRAFAGLGLVMEFLGHQVKKASAPRSRLPIELTAVEVGPSEHGREMISIDISEYGDPLSARTIRVPFSIYLKPWQQSAAIAAETLLDLPQIIVVPLDGRNWREGISMMRDPAAAIALAATVSTKIPESGPGMNRILAAYESSTLAGFHRHFYSQQPHSPEDWPDTYDRFSLDTLPGCARIILEQPNDLLLRPACIRRVVRVMIALGWHPRHIAGLILSKYSRPFGWTQFEGCDPALRADFYTRIFAGLFETGADDLIDFNCVSAQEQGVCSFAPCGDNLLKYRVSALNRRRYGKLAHRPFNRLLLQPEHS